MAITVENLTELAASNSEGRVRGSKIPHTDINFDFSGTANKFNLDDWTNCARSSSSHLAAAVRANARLPAGVKKVVTDWACTDSLARAIMTFMCPTLPGTWCDPGGEARVTFPVPPAQETRIVASADQQELFMFLVVAAIALHWRTKTGNALNLGSVAVKEGKTGPEETIKFNWTNLLQKVREHIKAQVLASAAPPKYDHAGQTSLDTSLFTIISAMADGTLPADDGFQYLIQKEIMIAEPHGNGYDWSKGARKPQFTDKGKIKDMNLALNHARFMMYVEWRMGYELCEKAGPTFTTADAAATPTVTLPPPVVPVATGGPGS